jgi:predicted aspartyl protease
LGLRWRRSGRAILADGSEVLLDVYDGIVLWDGAPRRIVVDAADADPLVGMALLHGHRLTVDVIDDGSVMIERLY